MLAPTVPINETQRLESLERSGLLNGTDDPRLNRIVKLASRLFGTPVTLISLVAADVQHFKARRGLVDLALPRQTSFCGHVVARAAPMVIKDTSQDSRFFDNPLVIGPPFIRFYAGYPIYFEGQVLGTLCLIDKKPRQFDDEDMETLESLAAWVENEIRLSAMTQEKVTLTGQLADAQRRAMTDSLTGAWTRRLLTEQLSEEVVARSQNGALSTVIAVDLDAFKAVNDQYGHDAGDVVLVELVKRLNDNLRENDLVIRLGGDEFVLFLGACPLAEAESLAQRLLNAVTGSPVVIDELLSVNISVSLGVASSNQLGLEPLLAMADDALYDSKKKGRHCWSSRHAIK
ncbi:sensor domain-containing diguanylate cyclase [Gallaecimonas mangrovi]|uniref:sensor domain-containing diguanylate cyclase n=1 Tax=Gallaecimonas mangrovi TaxID=2291597 RepID=UPI000E20370E|nr:sensor domain-containing diguanylate cyclase [Gallaecimonas mangrovi]